MPCTANGLYVVQGEMAILLTAMRRSPRWSSHSNQDLQHDVLIQSFNDLKDVLNQLGDLKDLDPNHYFAPFLEVIRAGEVSGSVTSLALSSVHKFLAYGLIEPSNKSVPATLEAIADAVTHTKFLSTDQTSDGVVLMKILQVLQTLVLSTVGALLTNESMCEIMLSCFRICFEHKLTEHIRKSAEFCLKDLVQHLFTRLPQFSEDTKHFGHVKKIKINKSAGDSLKQRRKSKQKKSTKVADETVTVANMATHEERTMMAETVASPMTEEQNVNIVDIQGNIHQDQLVTPESLSEPEATEDDRNTKEASSSQEAGVPDSTPCVIDVEEHEDTEPVQEVAVPTPAHPAAQSEETEHDYINPQGVRFTADVKDAEPEQPSAKLVPYGLGCIRELFRFLISLCNPTDKQNSDVMINVGLSLLRVAFEVGVDPISNFNSLLLLAKDELCRNLFSLLHSDKISIFALDIQVSFLLFESLRTHLKFQLEFYLTKLMEMIVSESPKVSYDQKEIALESVVQLWRIPGLVTELYLNYDCDLYCPNLFEDLTKLLSKNAFPVAGVYNTHLLSLDALLTIIDTIEGHCHNRILSERQTEADSSDADLVPVLGHRRMRISRDIPGHEQLMAVKRKKELLTCGTEQFNLKPKKGIQFLQEHHLLSLPLDPTEVVHFLRENPRLDKKMIGEFISSRSNLEVLAAFVKSFDFSDTRIDEALRLYLETFRLPGESPLISLIMEHFADHWHKCNGAPFANADAAFTLAYAVIMLNVDQHNHNVKRQNIPMSTDDFKKNLKRVNGGEDFDQDMLDEIYCAIREEEIVMPAEQTGAVRENYLWKVLLRRGTSKDGVYLHAPNGLYDHDLFALIWGPTITALSFVYDKSTDVTIYQKAISGFRKCAMISAHYGMSSDFDNLMISLCKFTNLTSSHESSEALTASFGSNPKAQLAAKTLFTLAHRHGDILREGWKNVLEAVLQLYRCKLLPRALVEAEDFLESSGKILLVREDAPLQKTETGLFSSLYSYIALGSESGSHRSPSMEDQELNRIARHCVKECRIEQIITESKFLRVDSLAELVKAIIAASQGHGVQMDQDASVFFLEVLLKVVIQNRDRAGGVWSLVSDHVCGLTMAAAAYDDAFLTERAVVGLLRLAIRLMRREDLSPIVLQSLSMLLLLRPPTLRRVSRQVAYGLYELLKTSAANIHTTMDWSIIFTLLECVGAGAPPPRVKGESQPNSDQGGTKSEGEPGSGTEDDSGLGNDRGYTSDQEQPAASPHSGGGWILVGPEGDVQTHGSYGKPATDLLPHDPFALVKCCESLAFLVRDVAHITPFNFERCVRCIRTFVEASLNASEKKQNKKGASKEVKMRKKKDGRRKEEARSPPRSPTGGGSAYDADESDPEECPSGYHQVCIQLLDLMHTLHTRTAHIFRWWAEESQLRDASLTSLWTQGWCPLLQGIARLCCDSRKQVRMTAITYLQRALLVHDLQTLTAEEWESCFKLVLFPLLARLLELEFVDEAHLEETRVRAATVLSKVFLHHLTPLLSLPSFTELWLHILDFMDKYMHVERSDLLMEAIPESLKNMLLVMDSAQVFSSADGPLPLWQVTWDRINAFLPGLKEDFFKAQSSVPAPQPVAISPPDPAAPIPLSIPGTLPEPTLMVGSPPPSAPSHPVLPPVATSAARGTSIILQPPSINQHYTTPILNHLGQQMLTTSISSQPAPVCLVPPEPTEPPESPDDPTDHSRVTIGSRGSAFVPYVNPNTTRHGNLYIPPTANIVSPVQMFAVASDLHRTGGLNDSPEDKDVPALSQYFAQSSQQVEAFDNLLSSSSVGRCTEPEPT